MKRSRAEISTSCRPPALHVGGPAANMLATRMAQSMNNHDFLKSLGAQQLQKFQQVHQPNESAKLGYSMGCTRSGILQESEGSSDSYSDSDDSEGWSSDEGTDASSLATLQKVPSINIMGWPSIHPKINQLNQVKMKQIAKFNNFNKLRKVDTNAIAQTLKTSQPPKQSLVGILVTKPARYQEGSEKPVDVLKQILAEDFKPQPYSSLESFFLQHDHKDLDIETVKAIRDHDLDTLKRLHHEGKSLQAATKFGESYLHLVCRRGTAELLDFLVHEACVSVRVCCDFGRTPLHDACWTRSPNFEMIKILLKDCPDMLLIQDKRGDTPLGYVPTEKYKDWCQFLNDNEDLLKPRGVLK